MYNYFFGKVVVNNSSVEPVYPPFDLEPDLDVHNNREPSGNNTLNRPLTVPVTSIALLVHNRGFRDIDLEHWLRSCELLKEW